MPRTAYYGVVPFLVHGIRVYAVHVNLLKLLNGGDDAPRLLRFNRVETDQKQPLEFGAFSSSIVYDAEWDKMNTYLDFQEQFCTSKKSVFLFLYIRSIEIHQTPVC